MATFFDIRAPLSLIHFVSRCPASFAGKLEAKTIAKAYSDNDAWTDLGTFGSGKKACFYKGKAYTESVDGHVALLVRAMVQYKLRKGIEEYPEEELPRVGRGGRKLQKNMTTRFFIKEMRHQGFIEDNAGTYKLIFIKLRSELPRGRGAADAQTR